MATETAYAQALAAVQAGEAGTADPSIPSYMVASDTLSMANGNQTFLEAAADTVESIPKFIAASLVSGANSLYNIPADIGNVFGGDFDRSETADVMASLDSDLGAFYEEHQEGVDLAGFVLSSIVPGLGGVKLLNAGQKSLGVAIQSGKFGENTSGALKLLIPKKDTFIRAARKEAVDSSAPVGLLNRNAIKAMGSGLAQNTMEALAFEIAVSTTLFKSPILENQDMGDFFHNVAWGAGLVGGFGLIVDAAKIKTVLKHTQDEAAVLNRPWEFAEAPAAKSKLSEKIALANATINDIPAVPNVLSPERAVKLQGLAEANTTKLKNSVRKDLGAVAKDDQEVARAVFQAMEASSYNSKQALAIGLEETSRVAERSVLLETKDALELALSKATVGTKSHTELTAQLDELQLGTSWVRMWGEGAGTAFLEKPLVTSVIDTLKKGERIEVSSSGVKAGKKKFAFNTKVNKGQSRPVKGKGVAAKKGRPFSHWDITAASAVEANARYLWAREIPWFKPTATKPLEIHVDDIPLMEKVMAQASPEEYAHIKFVGREEGAEAITSTNIKKLLGDTKIAVSSKLLKVEKTDGARHAQEEIAAMVNVKNSFLNGQLRTSTDGSAYHGADILAMQDNAAQYTNMLIDNGVWDASKGLVAVHEVPQHVRMVHNTKGFETLDNHVIENMAIIKGQQKLYTEGTDRATASVLGAKNYDLLEDISHNKVFEGAKPSGAGADFLTAANSDLGSLAASVENIGRTVLNIEKQARERTVETLEAALSKLGNNQKAAIEWSTLDARVRSIEGEYGLNAAGDALEPVLIIRWKKAAAEATKAGKSAPAEPRLSNPDMPLSLPLKSQEVRELAKLHIEVNSVRTGHLATLRSSQGAQFNRSPDVFFPTPVNPRDFPHFAMVTDKSITSGNQHSTLYARSGQELQAQIDKIKHNPQFNIRTRKEAEEFFDAEGRWSYEQTLSDNYMDVAMHRSGVSAPFIVATDPKKIVNDLLNWHLDRETGLVREAVKTKYEVPFAEMKRLGDQITNAETSRFGGSVLNKFFAKPVNNPFEDYVTTALGMSKAANYPVWTRLNTMADEGFSKLYEKIGKVWETVKTPEELGKLNSTLKEAGYKGVTYDETMEVFANVSAAKGKLATLVNRANSVIATVALRWDTINAANNAISANVLLGSGAASVVRGILNKDATAAGDLAKLANIGVPGTDSAIFAAKKLIHNSMLKFNRESAEMQFYKENGFITSISSQHAELMENLAFKGDLSGWERGIEEGFKKAKAMGDRGEIITGNKLAEEFNRFVAADVMKQMTDIGVKRGLMTQKESLAYINNFVNSTQGNYLAAQKPYMFQGPIGSALGLFQTYQFNLGRQLLRHVGEGRGKDASLLLGIQGTIHGMNGLPGFRAINENILGNASGNTEHRDAYSEVYGIAGKEAGDWLMYGTASNVLGLIHPDLKFNLYTRGDINPRHLTIVPTNPSSVPMIQATGKVFANIFNTAGKIAAGGDVTTSLLQGLEHNGLSRPLAGLAQVLQGLDNPLEASYSTSNRGNVVASNDLLSIANLTRMAGAKPLDEAIAIDLTYRIAAYKHKDSLKRNKLGAAIKTTMIAGKEPTQEQIEEFAEEYAKVGGRQEQFNQWFGQLYKTANLSQTNKIQQSLNSPFTQSMQKIMGGRELRDFTE
ncbi:MAG: hypothetical protein RPT13_03910 [SAR324 cluster bacterium]